jgi:hypothetical protein
VGVAVSLAAAVSSEGLGVDGSVAATASSVTAGLVASAGVDSSFFESVLWVSGDSPAAGAFLEESAAGDSAGFAGLDFFFFGC